MNKKIGIIFALVLVAFLVMGTASEETVHLAMLPETMKTLSLSDSMQNSLLTDIKTIVETMLVST